MLAYNQSDLYGVGYERNKSFDFSIWSMFSTQSAILVDILSDMELVLASDCRFLLGNWVQDALQFAQSEEETHFYNFNAKLQVSIWGNNYTLELYDYANKFWSGMIREYVLNLWLVLWTLSFKVIMLNDGMFSSIF